MNSLSNTTHHQHPKKANSILGLIQISFKHIDCSNMPQLYKTMVQPQLEYGNTVWWPALKCQRSELEKVQHRAMKLIPELKHCCCCSAFRDLWKEMGWLQFSDLYRTASSTIGGWSRWNILMCYIYIYHSEHYGLSSLDLTYAIFYKVSLFCIHFYFCKYTLNVCYVFNVNLTDSFDDRRSQCRLI